MSQHERVATHCRELLASRNLAYTFNGSVITHHIRKHKSAQANAFIVALKCADKMIEEYQPEQHPELEQYDF